MENWQELAAYDIEDDNEDSQERPLHLSPQKPLSKDQIDTNEAGEVFEPSYKNAVVKVFKGKSTENAQPTQEKNTPATPERTQLADLIKRIPTLPLEEASTIQKLVENTPPQKQSEVIDRITHILIEMQKLSPAEFRTKLANTFVFKDRFAAFASQVDIKSTDDDVNWALPLFLRSQIKEFEEIKPQLVAEISLTKPEDILIYMKEPKHQVGYEASVELAFKAVQEKNDRYALFYFLCQPENRNSESKEQVFASCIQYFVDSKDWAHLAKHLFSYPENRALFPELLQQCLSELKASKPNYLQRLLRKVRNTHNTINTEAYFSLLSEPEFQTGNEADVILFLKSFPSDFYTDNPKQIADFFNHPENIDKYGMYLDEIVKKINNNQNNVNQIFRIQLLLIPSIRKRYPEKFEEVKDVIFSSFNYCETLYSYAENQRDLPQQLYKTLDLATSEYNKFVYGFRLFRDTLLIDSESSRELMDFMDKQLAQIADKALREMYKKIFHTFLTDKSADLFQLASSSIENVTSVCVAGSVLGLEFNSLKTKSKNPVIADSILPSLGQLAARTELKGLFKTLEPKVIETMTSSMLVDWISYLNTTLSLIPNEEIAAFLSDHFASLNQAANTSDAQNEMNKVVIELRTTAITQFNRLLNLETPMEFETIELVLKKWNGDIKALTTLARHYATLYPEGLTQIGKIILEIAQDTFLLHRYDLSNPLIAKQLAPLLRGIENPTQKQTLINTWRDPQPTFHLVDTGQNLSSDPEAKGFGAQLGQELRTRALHNGHLLEALKTLGIPRENLESVTELIGSYLKPEHPGAETENDRINKIKSIEESLNLAPEMRGLLLSLYQLFKSFLKMDRDGLNKSVDKWLAKAQHHPQLLQSVFVQEDIMTFLRQELKPVEKSTRKKFYITAMIDDPKVIFEIGKYPGAGSCQNYESLDKMNRALTGYVQDSQILADCLFEVQIEGTKVIQPEKIESVVALNAALQTAQLKLSDGTIHEVNISKPVARKMVILGQEKNTQQARLQVQPLYRTGVDYDLAEELLNAQVVKKLEAIQGAGQPITQADENEELIIAGSHNPFGHYNDWSHGPVGANGETYQSKLNPR
jgi:hypothetical protein